MQLWKFTDVLLRCLPLVVLAILLSVGLTPAQAQATILSITVDGEGVASSEPDIASVTLGAEILSTDLEGAISSINGTLDAITSSLLDIGIRISDVQTVGVQVIPQDLLDSQTGGVSGRLVYRVQGTQNVIVRDVTQVPRAINQAVGSGANIISDFQFGIQRRGEIERLARSAAIENARERANQLAEGLGLRVGEPMQVDEISITRGFPTAENPGTDAANLELGTASANVGEYLVTVQIRVTFRARLA